MISFSRKFCALLACAGAVLLISGCGGSGRGDNGWAPENIQGYALLLIPGTPSSGGTPGMISITEGEGSMGEVNLGMKYPAQVTYIKTGDNTASVAIALHTPEIHNATTYTYVVAADIEFNEDGVTGSMLKWDFYTAEAGTASKNVGYGSSGRIVLSRP